MQKTEVNDKFKTYTIKNLTAKPFVHEYDGTRIVIGSKKQITLPAAAAKDVAYHLAQRVLAEKNLPFFGQEHDDEISNILGIAIVKPVLIEEFDGDTILDGEFAGEDIEEEEEVTEEEDTEEETSDEEDDSESDGIVATKKPLNSKPKATTKAKAKK